ncbi:hypothetical protein NBRC3255_3145 [Gluconobacter thailandicus NBRC 3255]|nr:hypothetical protein NBRC3255_3145 [Gluconobacter thailandicus NBRC 3255]
MRQKVAKHEGQVIEWKARRSPHGTDNRALLLGDTPWQPLWPAWSVLTRLLTALTPFADGFVADAIAPGNDARRLGGSCDLCSHRGGGSCLGWICIITAPHH